ncbi:MULTISPECIES: DUF4059 family protein [Streptococcus]|uniref:Hydrogenase-4 membrane subunit HyfE n=2 Tax=Streptococcus TaxID=1301 RepID=A0ABS2PR57_9STRE|nr:MULTISPECIES: DUF4059 family protein [Streptococcus]MBM7636214.1 hydrogenase-4 membrane subunit HyfE [Streptococcus saliviloxodontae]MBM7642401.1 hydrogenase-4 membrane subunit HyfE [Streptococcus loxodontisalivarius]
MLLDIFSFYIQGLMVSILVVTLFLAGWLFFRASRKLDKTVRERQAALYDALMMAMVSIPILSFAFMAIILMIRSN